MCEESEALFDLHESDCAERVSKSEMAGNPCTVARYQEYLEAAFRVGIASKEFFEKTQRLKTSEWTPVFAQELYTYLAKQKVYITNFAKCTQSDARALKNGIFHAYRELLLKEIQLIRPKKIVTFGNLVSSLLLEKPIKVSEYSGSSHEVFKIGNTHYAVYPTFYPVGQGMRNLGKAVVRIRVIRKRC